MSKGTHLVGKIMNPRLKIKSVKLKMFGSLCNQTVNLKTGFKTLYTVY